MFYPRPRTLPHSGRSNSKPGMDWKRTIEQNRRALAGVIAGLIAMAGHGDPLPPPLRPAEISAQAADRHCRGDASPQGAERRETGRRKAAAGFRGLCPPEHATRLPADRSAQARGQTDGPALRAPYRASACRACPNNWHRPHSALKSKPSIGRLGFNRNNLLRFHN